MNEGQSVTVNPITCTRCHKEQWPQIDKKTGEIIHTKACIHCKNPYYRKPIQRHTTSEARKKKK